MLVLFLSIALLVPCCGYALTHDVYPALYPLQGYPQRLVAGIPAGAPVVFTTLPPFALLTTYDPTHRYTFLLDWTYDLDPRRVQGDLSGQRLMENWKRAGYEADRILPCAEVLRGRFGLLPPARLGQNRLVCRPVGRQSRVPGAAAPN